MTLRDNQQMFINRQPKYEMNSTLDIFLKMKKFSTKYKFLGKISVVDS